MNFCNNISFHKNVTPAVKQNLGYKTNKLQNKTVLTQLDTSNEKLSLLAVTSMIFSLYTALKSIFYSSLLLPEVSETYRKVRDLSYAVSLSLSVSATLLKLMGADPNTDSNAVDPLTVLAST